MHIKSMRPLHNSYMRQFGLDPKSGNYLKILDSGFRRNGKNISIIKFFKGLSMKKTISYTLIFSSLFSSALMPLVEAAPRHSPQPKVNAPGKAMERLPPGHKEIWVGRTRYFRHNGIFYRRGHSGFIAVDPPIGAIVISLPLGAMALLIGGITYYACQGIYYRRIEGGYLVVKHPTEPVAKEISPIVPLDESVGETVSVTVPLLNVRSGPGSNFPVIFQVNEEELLFVHGYAPDWLYVQSRDNDYGWVMLKYTSYLSTSANG